MTKYCILLFILMLAIPSVMAQDNASNLLDILNAIPDSLDNRDSFISYVDYRAAELARSGAANFDSWDEFMADNQSLEAGLYFAVLRGISSGSSFLTDIFSGGELWEATVGFDFFDIDRSLTFGNPPEQVDILVGDFNTEAIASAFTARNFKSEPHGDFELWCGEIGCENGLTIDIANRNPGNPFGGNYGRQQPLLVSDTLLISSASYPTLSLSQEAASDEVDSIADNPSYIAAVNSINPENILIQANFIYFTQIVPSIPIDITDTDIDIEALDQEMADLGDLPQYELILIADTATDTEQVVYVTLVYYALEDAEKATELIPERLATMDSLRVDRPLQEVLDSRGISDILASAVFDEATDRALAVFEFHAPLASDIEDEALGLVASSMVYRLFIDMLYSRDTDWLVAGTGDS